MPSFNENCVNYYGTKDLYDILQISKTSTNGEIKKSYRRLSLLVHPDRVPEEEKENATEKFKILCKAYSILSDDEKRAVYDDTGCYDDDDDGILDGGDWYDYWRKFFKEIDLEDISSYEKKYKNSKEEEEDLLSAYNRGKGDMEFILSYVPFSSPDDEDRLREILQSLILDGKLEEYEAFTQDSPRKREARKRKWTNEAKLAEKAKKEYLKKKSRNVQAEEGELDLAAAIMKRKAQREADSNSFFKSLEEKYCKPKGKGKKAK